MQLGVLVRHVLLGVGSCPLVDLHSIAAAR